MMVLKWGKPLLVRWGAVLAIAACLATASAFVFAATPASDFYIQVSPSPLVTTVKPGQTQNLELKVRNSGTGTEELRIDPRRFNVDKTTGEVTLDDQTPSEIAKWISFSTPTFKIKPGEWTTLKIRIAIPKEA